MFAQPQKEHEWLQQLVGSWRYETVCPGEPGQPPMKSSGEETVHAIGGLWIVAEGRGEMPDGNTGYTHMTIGYDPQKAKYVGTWQGSMMTHLWLYEGTLDPSGKILPLSSTGPDFTNPGKMANYQDIIEIVSPDHRILRSRAQGEDGQWTQFMEANYYRTA